MMQHTNALSVRPVTLLIRHGPGTLRPATQMLRFPASSNATFVTSYMTLKEPQPVTTLSLMEKSTAPRRMAQDAGSFVCDFCDERFPSKKSVSQHVRNQHASEASNRRAAEAAQRPIRQWLDSEHALFLEALRKQAQGG